MLLPSICLDSYKFPQPCQASIQKGTFNFSSCDLVTLKYTHKLKQTRPPVASRPKRNTRSVGKELWRLRVSRQWLWVRGTEPPRVGQFQSPHQVVGKKEKENKHRITANKLCLSAVVQISLAYKTDLQPLDGSRVSERERMDNLQKISLFQGILL